MALVITDFIDSQDYDALALRRVASAMPTTAGVIPSREFPDPMRAAKVGTEFSPLGITVSAGAMWLRGWNSGSIGWYHVVNEGAYETILTIDHLTGTQQSFDMLVVGINDSTDVTGDTQDRAYFQFLQGTPRSSVTWNNDPATQQPPVLGNNQAPLALIENEGQSPSGTPSVSNDNIRDIRAYAGGLRWRSINTLGDEVVTSTGFDDLTPYVGTRITPQSSIVRCRLSGYMTCTTVMTATFAIRMGHQASTLVTSREISNSNELGVSRMVPINYEWFVPVTPGSSIFMQPVVKVNSGSITIHANTTYPLVFEMEEMWRPDYSNG